MLVKICGISTLEAAQVAADEGADLIGFVIAPSTRRIEKIAQEVGLDYIQLHGDETAEFARELSLPVIKAININDTLIFDLNQFPATYFIIDSPGKKHRGGSGETFDWNALTQTNINF